jgi:hypothetical protein
VNEASESAEKNPLNAPCASRNASETADVTGTQSVEILKTHFYRRTSSKLSNVETQEGCDNIDIDVIRY